MNFNQELFDRVADRYDESPPFFSTLGRVLVERTCIRDGSSVVDLGAGKGAVTIALRASLPSSPITAVDLSPAMLAAVDSLGLDHVDTLLADVTHLPLEDEAFDHAVSGFTLHILADQEAAFREIHRVLAPGGSLTWSLPGTHPETQDWTQEYSAIYRRYQDQIETVPAEMTPTQDIDALLADAGFVVDAVENVPVSIPVGDAEGYWAWTQSHGARWLTDALPPPEAEALHQEVVASLRRLHPTAGADIMVAPHITRMLRS
ncbi:MAG: methyltransferase domain-containing protein [Gordonia polyisoprenivorans]|nr:methyltransferase domain-containing protein [Gordonia polyisoprenivorans]